MAGFVGRVDLLQRLTDRLNEPGTTVLFGPPGSGKSAVAEELVRRSSAAQYMALEVEQTPSDVAAAARASLQLLVVDNAPQHVSANELSSLAMHVLLVRRARGSGDIAVEMPPLSAEEGIAILESVLEEHGGRADPSVLGRIVRVLDGHALSLAAAAGLMRVFEPEALLRTLRAYDGSMSISERVERVLGDALSSLSERLQRTVVECSAFFGPFQPADAAAPSARGDGEVFDDLSALRERSILVREAGALRLPTPLRMLVQRLIHEQPVWKQWLHDARQAHASLVQKEILDGQPWQTRASDARAVLLRPTIDHDRIAALVHAGRAFEIAASPSALLAAASEEVHRGLSASLNPQWRALAPWVRLIRYEWDGSATDASLPDKLDELEREAPENVFEPARFTARLRAFRVRNAIHTTGAFSVRVADLDDADPALAIAAAEAFRARGDHVDAEEILRRRLKGLTGTIRMTCLQYLARVLRDQQRSTEALNMLGGLLEGTVSPFRRAILQLDRAAIHMDLGEDHHGLCMTLGDTFEHFGHGPLASAARAYALASRASTMSDLAAYVHAPQLPMMGGWAAALAARRAAEAGDRDGSEAFERRCLELLPEVSVAQYFHAAQVELGTARGLLDRPLLDAHRLELDAFGYERFVPVRHAKRARQRVGVRVEALAPELTITARGVRSDGVNVDYRATSPQALIVRSLALHQWSANRPVALAQLVRDGWPDEYATARGMKNRLRVTLTTLRKKGLQIELDGDAGYRLMHRATLERRS